MTDAIRATGPADILGFIPHALGNAPRESFVFVTLQGNRLGATLRVDAPMEAAPGMFARAMRGYLAADTAATAVLLAVYTDQSAPDAPRPFHGHIEALIEVFETAGTPLKDGWLVTNTHWQNLLCDSEAGCCAPQPLDSIKDSNLNAEMVFRGSAYAAEPGTTYAPYTGPVERIETITAHYEELANEDMSAPRALWQAALQDTGEIPSHHAMELVAAFQILPVRDVLLCNILDPNRPTADNSGDLLLGIGISPDWARVDKAQERARELIGLTPEGYRAPLLTLIGWIEFLKGRSSSAADHFEQAVADRPDFRLAVLLGEVINRGTVAAVALDPVTSYKRER